MTDLPEALIHPRCGKPMTRSRFGNNDPAPSRRSQPIWTCVWCSTWEPREGWAGPLPSFFAKLIAPAVDEKPQEQK
jgi:hypothetical protein